MLVTALLALHPVRVRRPHDRQVHRCMWSECFVAYTSCDDYQCLPTYGGMFGSFPAPKYIFQSTSGALFYFPLFCRSSVFNWASKISALPPLYVRAADSAAASSRSCCLSRSSHLFMRFPGMSRAFSLRWCLKPLFWRWRSRNIKNEASKFWQVPAFNASRI